MTRDTETVTVPDSTRRPLAGFGWGTVIFTLGGLVGLDGAEFRLPVLIGVFRFPPLEAVILNKATSLVVVVAAVFFRSAVVPAAELRAHAAVIVDLLVGSLAGAWLAAGWATRLPRERFHRVIAVLLVAIAAVLLFGHGVADGDGPWLDGPALSAVGIAAGFLVGAAASLSGVAGGELLIPTIVLLFGADLRLAGSLALAVGLPTMLADFAPYSRDASCRITHRSSRHP